ncbi:MAG: hypothetical protein LBO74_17245 [Candidatus Symbiothrix sp.]|jgi:hypothetical protein|nr:hypothetical protein [Candidatus Symbiothrix sp.]
MKKFIIKAVIAFLLSAILCSVIPFYLLKTSKYEKYVSGRKTYISIRKSKEVSPQKKLILGDSVAEQLFPNAENDSAFISLACNQAIEVIGHYLLLNNYLNAGNQVDTVYFIYLPFNFQNNLNQVYTYHNFLKPFYSNEYKPYFSKTAFDQIEKIPYTYLVREPHILTSNWAPEISYTDSIDYDFLSPLSIEYLDRIKLLAEKNNFELIILPPPLNIQNKKFVDTLNKEEIFHYNLSTEFKDYFENIIYVEDYCFFDGIHLKEEYIKQYSDIYKEKWIHSK